MQYRESFSSELLIKFSPREFNLNNQIDYVRDYGSVKANFFIFAGNEVIMIKINYL